PGASPASGSAGRSTRSWRRRSGGGGSCGRRCGRRPSAGWCSPAGPRGRAVGRSGPGAGGAAGRRRAPGAPAGALLGGGPGRGGALVVGLGAWLSVRCPTPLRAFRLCMPVVVAVVGLPVLAWRLPEEEAVIRPVELLAWSAAAFAVSAVVCWWRAGAGLDRGQ